MQQFFTLLAPPCSCPLTNPPFALRNALRLSADSDHASLPSFHLGGNPIECNCDMVWFKSVNDAAEGSSDGGHNHNYPRVVDIESIYCRLVYAHGKGESGGAFVPLVEARNEQFLCPYETHCFALCKCCDFDACDCEMSCPDGCACYHDASWSKNVAVCSAADFQVGCALKEANRPWAHLLLLSPC